MEWMNAVVPAVAVAFMGGVFTLVKVFVVDRPGVHIAQRTALRDDAAFYRQGEGDARDDVVELLDKLKTSEDIHRRESREWDMERRRLLDELDTERRLRHQADLKVVDLLAKLTQAQMLIEGLDDGDSR